jgi:hypothetical protein
MNVGAVSRRFGAAALVIGPLSLVLGSLFQVAGDDDSVSVSLAKIAVHPSAERGVIICDLLAGFMLPAVLYLMRLTGPRALRLTLAGGTVAFAAWLAGPGQPGRIRPPARPRGSIAGPGDRGRPGARSH